MRAPRRSADSSEPDSTMNSNWYDLTGFQRDLLQAIADLERNNTDPISGSALRSALEDRYAADIVTARVYQNLDDLVEAELVTKTRVDGRTKEYRLADGGWGTLEDHARDAAESAGFGPAIQAITDGGERA